MAYQCTPTLEGDNGNECQSQHGLISGNLDNNVSPTRANSGKHEGECETGQSGLFKHQPSRPFGNLLTGFAGKRLTIL